MNWMIGGIFFFFRKTDFPSFSFLNFFPSPFLVVKIFVVKTCRNQKLLILNLLKHFWSHINAVLVAH